jgi:hypothetical protein
VLVERRYMSHAQPRGMTAAPRARGHEVHTIDPGHLLLRGRGPRAARTVEAAWVWETKGGKISYMGFYLDPGEAMRAVGLPR